jgi:hypothetical protein
MRERRLFRLGGPLVRRRSGGPATVVDEGDESSGAEGLETDDKALPFGALLESLGDEHW